MIIKPICIRLVPYARPYGVTPRSLYALWLYSQGLLLDEIKKHIGKCTREGNAYKVDDSGSISRGRVQQIIISAICKLSRHQLEYWKHTRTLRQWSQFYITQLIYASVGNQANILSRTKFIANHPWPPYEQDVDLDDPPEVNHDFS